MLQCNALLVGDPGGEAELGWVKMSSTMCSWYLSTSRISLASFPPILCPYSQIFCVRIWSFRPPATTAIHTSLQRSLMDKGGGDSVPLKAVNDLSVQDVSVRY